jgi:uncharacterized integral membrane protein
MLRRLVLLLVVLPITVLLVALSIANRESVAVSFDPFSSTHPALVLTVPLYLICFCVLIAGVLIGGIAAWLVQGKWRRAARQRTAELRATRAELEALRRRPGLRSALPATLDRTPPAVLRSPAA